MKERMACGIAMMMVGVSIAFAAASDGSTMNIVGISVTPHVMADSMRYARDPEPAAGARVQLFVRNDAKQDSTPLVLDSQTRMLFDGKSPADLLAAHIWAWHDTPAAMPDESLALPSGALTVWTFNGRVAPFGPGGRVRVEVGPEGSPWLSKEVSLDKPACWLSAITFLGPDAAIQPDTMVVHIANASDSPMEIRNLHFPTRT